MEQDFRTNNEDRCPIQDAVRIQYQAAATGFDWPDIHGVLLKVQEEVDELDEAIASGNDAHARDELGDLLFACFSVARFLNADVVTCLDHATKRFAARFQCVKDMANKDGRALETCPAALLNAYWEQAKKLMRQ